MASFGDRYEDLGLRRNPFAAWQLEEPLPDTFVDRGIPSPPPPASKTLVQILGESGFGKSTHIRHWQRLADGPYHYIPRRPIADRRIKPPIGDLVYGDEIDRMPWQIRRRWFHELAALGATLVIGTHTDLARLGRRSGFEVITHHLEAIGAEELAEMIDARLEAESIRPDSFRFTPTQIEQALAQSRGIPRLADIACHKLLAEAAGCLDNASD